MEKLLKFVWKWLWPIIAQPLAEWVSKKFRELLDQIGELLKKLWERWKSRNNAEQEAVSKKMDQASQETKEAKSEYQKGYHQGQADTYAEVLKTLKQDMQDMNSQMEKIQVALEELRKSSNDKSAIENDILGAIAPMIQLPPTNN